MCCFFITLAAILIFPAAFIVGDLIDNWDLRLFKKGLIMDIYVSDGHGKFKKRNFLVSYEILDVDGKYAMVRNLKTGKEHEDNLYLSINFSDLVLRTNEGEVIKHFNKK